MDIPTLLEWGSIFIGTLFIALLVLLLWDKRAERKEKEALAEDLYEAIFKMVEVLDTPGAYDLAERAGYYYFLWKSNQLTTEDVTKEYFRMIDWMKKQGVVVTGWLEDDPRKTQVA